MISDEVVQRIRRYRSEGVSLREISRATGISVNTIRRYLADPMLGMVPRPKQIRKSKLDILSKENFESIYRACKGNCAAIALAVKLMLQETQPEFSVSRSAVRRHLLSRYPELRPQKLDPVPFFVEPGQQLQIDFVQCEFRFTGQSEPTVLKVFEAVYSYSRRAFFLICPDLTQKSWLTGITQCLARWGIPRQILCDNDIGLVRRGVKPGEAKFNPRFQWLCDTIGVQPKACRPLRPQTKGRVERLGSTLKHSCLVVAQSLVDTKQGFEIHTIEQLQAFVDQWLHQQADIPKYLIPNGRKVSENDLYAQEKPFLVFPEKLASLLQVATYPLIIPRSAVVWLHGTKFRVSPRYAQQPAEVTFAADGSFIIALPSGLPIFHSGISAENLSSYRWDERLETPAFAEEIDDDRESSADRFLEQINDCLEPQS